MKFLKKIFQKLGSPISAYPISFFFLLLVLTLYPFYSHFTEFFHYKFIWRFIRIISPELLFVIIACLIFLITSKINKFLQYITIGIIHVILYFFSITDAFLTRNFGCHMNSFMLQLVDQTDEKEATEFISTYMGDINNILLIISYLLIGIVEFSVYKKKDSIKSKILKVFPDFYVHCKTKLRTFGAFITVFSLSSWIILIDSYTISTISNISKLGTIIDVDNNVLINSVKSFSQYSSEAPLFEQCAKSQKDLSVSGCSYASENIVVVIGESHNKRHSSLYGYPLKTNPRLESLNENIYVFEDVIASVNVTYQSLRNILSFSSMDKNNKWYQTPLFPCAFKSLGYNVVFWSNQFVKSVDMYFADASCGFLYHPLIEPKVFTHSNKIKFEYDGQLIDSYKTIKDSIEKDANYSLTIFHLLGQHVNPAEKYPKEQEFFVPKDYLYRQELNDWERQQVADYDNATLYNDSVLYEIIKMYEDKDAIVIYFPDHGDEAHDYRSHVGRTHFVPRYGAYAAHCQYDIPFIIYVSDLYKKKHPEIVSRIEASINLPYETDDVPHLLCDLAGIKSKWFDPSRSIINDSFNVNRKRLVKDIGYSEPFDYDSICRGTKEWQIGWKK